jgi:hypothetical protein
MGSRVEARKDRAGKNLAWCNVPGFLANAPLESILENGENHESPPFEFMVGLGGLEPPSSPLSGAFKCYMHSIFFARSWRSTVARCDIKTFREGHPIQFVFSKISMHSSSVSSCHFSFERYGRNSLSYLSRRIWELSFFVLKM